MKALATTNIGKVRKHNEDAYYLPKGDERFAAIADGMGGHLAGEVASALAIEVFVDRLRKAQKPDEDTLMAAVGAANRAIYEASAADRDKRGMGTTLTAIWFGAGSTFLSHVGDSRAYLLRDRALMQMTNDHSLVGELLEKGEITASEARVHPHRNVITRALGTSRQIVPDIMHIDSMPGDEWLLCSDGLSNHVQHHELARIMLLDASYEEKLRMLVDLALERGGSDNITVLLASAREEART